MTTVYESIGAIVWFLIAFAAFAGGGYALQMGRYRRWPLWRSLLLGIPGIAVYIGMGWMSINL
ncbi:DUF4407 domain-containing protein [Rhodococcus qingshengii]|uniref:DUF4407 domain-containing protein n=1 Tax=Rhodococcus TaxID=1827 RepID=UPI001E4C5177|nr:MULTISPECIES: DUF4407 domain-containing protein [Rhodococcus]MCD2099581.1 DUF4407 domain-containing protein [Rhodococcus rhodochrous]MCD2123949.1 DUF4407 domain-containing protein [Rhodococcus rhodochrous]MCQ4136622.1 DUF4407 domain-containing protein [Rhodococcus rhodochrous]MDJ0490593.1 DUF4407 domain-containing protein [Rhodococcus qingshengii]